MSTKKRRHSDRREALYNFWRDPPHDVLFPFLGCVLGVGSPIGALLMRFWLANPILKEPWIRYELKYNFLFYAYMGVGSVAAFTLFGYVLGRRSESERIRSNALSTRVEELRLKSVTDGLTGVFTHGYLYEILQLEIQRALTGRYPLSVLVLDIDDFKRINDNHGHLFGDRVIKETAETISANIRTNDILGRMGGDEFLVIMPTADAPIALQVARRVCANVAKNGYLVTVSIGMATFSGHDQQTTAAQILERADANLYEAKRLGKNQVSAARLRRSGDTPS